MDARVITGYVIVFLYVMAPLENLLQHIPLFNLAKVSSDRIAEVTGQLASDEPAAESGMRLLPGTQASEVVLDGVMHRYYREREEQLFTLGPIHLRLRAGELIFLVGSNGCGKTTLAKLLLGLYAPESGRILLDGVEIDDRNRDRYRQTFSAIFADFHLFDSLTGAPSDRLDERGNEWLRRLQLDHKVTLENGAFSTRDLSQGQRKRLALVASCLEDRPFLVFDEWASDQDPAFREVFYREILPDLRARGKTVLVISHDDRYFHLGDRLIRMEDGRIAGEDPAGQRPHTDTLHVVAA